MKVALCFYGITRSLKYTIESIKLKIFDVFDDNDIEYDIFMHTYELPSEYYNKRSFEKTNNYDNDEYKLLNPKYLQIDNQEKVKQEIDLMKYRTHPDPWKSNYKTVDNFILAQYSKSQVVKLVENSNNIYDYVIYLRPDVLYLNKFDINFFKRVNSSTVCNPCFGRWGKFKFNDRFLLSDMNNYKIFGDVFPDLYEISKLEPLHSETIIGRRFKQKKVHVCPIHFFFARMRCNGRLFPYDKNSLRHIIDKNK